MGKGLSDAVVNVAFQATNDFLPVVILTVALAGALRVLRANESSYAEDR